MYSDIYCKIPAYKSANARAARGASVYLYVLNYSREETRDPSSSFYSKSNFATTGTLRFFVESLFCFFISSFLIQQDFEDSFLKKIEISYLLISSIRLLIDWSIDS